jgi:hypothetical protein
MEKSLLVILKRIAVPGLFLIAGLAIGGGSVELNHRRVESKSKDLFQQRIRCKSLADKYARENTNDSQTAILEMVDFSPSLNSCIAEFRTWEKDYRDWELVDVLSGKQTSMGGCFEGRNCGNGKDMKLDADLEAAFRLAVDGSKQTSAGKK